MDSYFNGVWQDQDFKSLKYSGYQLVDYVNAKKPTRVLDVGCGFNKFKGKIDHLWGIDPYNDAADVKCSIEGYDGPMVDIALCLGSINFGDEETIDHQIEILDSIWMKECIFRVNPGLTHTWVDKSDIDGVVWYPWTKEKVYEIAKQYKYNVDRFEKEYTIHGHLRYYFVFTK